MYERQQVRHNAVALVDEAEALFAQVDRPGNLVGATLRQMWSGTTAGQTNADPERNRKLAAGSYNLGLLVGMQNDIAGRLLNDTGTGMAQRFAWVAATDVHLRDDVPGWLAAAPPAPLQWTPPDLPGSPGKLEAFMQGQDAAPPEPVRMRLDPNIAAWLRSQQIARSRGDVAIEERDSQRTALHVKASGVLAWLDGRLSITADDWQLAGGLLDTSDRVREALLEHAEEVIARDRTEKGIERAQISAAETQATDRREEAAKHVRRVLAGVLAQGMTRGELTRSVGVSRRPFLAEVLTDMTAAGEVREERAHSGGRRYTLVRGE